MEKRTNAGYIIIRQIKIDNTEIVLGENLNSEISKYVTWIYYNDTYYGGHYLNDLNEATIDFFQRVYDECKFVVQQLDKRKK